MTLADTTTLPAKKPRTRAETVDDRLAIRAALSGVLSALGPLQTEAALLRALAGRSQLDPCSARVVKFNADVISVSRVLAETTRGLSSTQLRSSRVLDVARAVEQLTGLFSVN